MSRKIGEKDAEKTDELALTLEEGMVFETYVKFYDALKRWCKKHNHPIKVKRSQRAYNTAKPDFAIQKISFCCKHAGEPKPRGKNLRKLQSYYASGCPMLVNVNLIKKPTLRYRVSKVVAKHNHPTGAEYMKLYPENRIPDKTILASLENFFKYDVPTSKIRAYLAKTFDKKVSSKDVTNMRYRYKLNTKEGNSDSEAKPLLVQLEELANGIRASHPDSVVFQDKPMKEPDTKCQDAIIVDGTYEDNLEGYSLYSVVCEEGREDSTAVSSLSQSNSDPSPSHIDNVAMEICVIEEEFEETVNPVSPMDIKFSRINVPSIQPQEEEAGNETTTSNDIEEEHEIEEKSVQEQLLLSLQQQTDTFRYILQEIQDMRKEMGQVKAEELALKREELSIRREELALSRLRSS